jgi:hypothetical protein
MYLAGGAALGPEAALSNVGGGMATFITEHWVHFEDDNDRKLVVLSGIQQYQYIQYMLITLCIFICTST